MTIGRTAVTALLVGVLVSTLSGCDSDGEGSPDPAATGNTADAPLRSRIAAPAAFDSAKGWEIEAAWLPEGQPFPYAVSAKAGKVAYLNRTERGYVLNVRDGASGKLSWASKPWQAPQLTKEQGEGPSWRLTVPRVTLVMGGEREYYAVWAYGEKSKDQLHEAEEVISAAFYPADASGSDIAPHSTADVAASIGTNSPDLRVFPGAKGLLVMPNSDDPTLVSPDGSATSVNAPVKIGGEPVVPDNELALPGPAGLVTNGDRGSIGDAGGFGVDGGWHSTTVAPSGADAVLKENSIVNGIVTKPNGRIVGAAGSHLIASWNTGSGLISAVHDLGSGKVQATATCDTVPTSYEVHAPKDTDRADTPPALSPNGGYLVKGGTAFDLTTGRGYCADSGENAKEIVLTCVGDDGLGYGLAEGDSTPRVPVTVSARTGAAEPLPEATEIPDALASGAGVFVTYAGQDTARLIVLNQR